MMLTRFIAILVFMCYCPVQGASLKGLIVDSETGEPLFGVALIYRDVPVAFSDDEGHFTLPVDNMKLQDVILFRHLSFHDQEVTFSRLCTDSVIRMENRYYLLSAVTVTPVNYQKLIKTIVTNYEKAAPANPWWTKIHQAQSVTYRGERSSYVEYTGYMLCMGRNIKNPLISNKWLPEHIRRTKESPALSVLSPMLTEGYRVRSGEHSIDNVWTEYRFFDMAHPLGKYHKCYAVSVDSSFTMDGKEYWALSYRQKERIMEAGWSLSNICGQMWVEKNTNTLAKLTGSCNRSDMFVTQVSIDYGTFDQNVVPREMNISVLHNKTIRGRQRLQDKILYKSRISFAEADSRKKKKYKGDYNSVMPELYIPELPYESEYWLPFPVNGSMDFSQNTPLPVYRDNNAISFQVNDSMDFSEGAPLPVFRDNDDPTLQEFRVWTQQGQQQMKNEIEQSAWKSIQPIK